MGKQFGDNRSRKDIHDEYLAHGGNDIAEPGQIGNVNSLSDFDSKKSGNFGSPAPPSPENLRYGNNIKFLKNYFSDRQTHFFKNGLELANKTGNKSNVSNIENLDEDPVIFGFDFIINHISSPLYTELPSFFDFANSNGLGEIINRKSIYSDFIEHLELLFLSTRGGEYDSFKSHYLIGIEGLGNLINKSTGISSNKQFSDFGKDKITLTMREDTHLSGGYLTALYNTLSYSKINGKQIIPDNLLRFDATVVVSEIRNYKKIMKKIKKGGEGDPDVDIDENDQNSGNNREIVSLVNDSVSRYMYNIYDCQFVLENHSHESNVKNDSKELTNSFKLDFFYKFSSMEMEKFKYSPEGSISKYLNDGNPVDPKRKYVGEKPDNTNAVRRNEFLNRNYQEGLDPYAIYDEPTSNNIKKGHEVIQSNDDEMDTMKHNSEQGSNDVKKDNQKEKRNEFLNKNKNRMISKGDGALGGYSDLLKDGNLAKKFGEGGGLKGIVNRTKDFALNKIRKKRNDLINDTLQSIRTSTGLRRINNPTNVYDDNLSVFGKLKNELGDFTNTKISGLI